VYGLVIALTLGAFPARAGRFASDFFKVLSMSDKIQNPIVVKSLQAANKAAGSMLSHCRNAAELASADFDAAKTPADNISEVTKLYAPNFAGFDANVRQNFVAYLTILAAPQTPVTVTKKVDKEPVDVHTTPAELLQKSGMSKHTLHDIAKQVREVLGTARKSGGGRKPETKPTTLTPTVDRDQTDEQAFLNWADNMAEYLKDAVYRPRIDARLIEMGLSLTKVKTTPGRVVKGTASA
jgi:hypothetical protein